MDEDGCMHFGVGDVHVEKNRIANIGIFGKSSSELLCSLPVARQATYDASSQQDDEKCLEGTRTEVLKEMTAFARGGGEQHIFWLNGMAGSGKSTIARTLAEELHKEGLLGASFFFKRGFGDVSHAGKLFTTIAWQLTSLSSELEKLVCESIRKNPDIYDKARKEQWTTLIRQPLSEMRQTSPPRILVIVIDALDECDSDNDMEGIVALLAEAEEISPIKVRIVVTSRPERSIRLGFRKLPVISHRDLMLDDRPSEEVNADIRRFYHHQFREIKDQQDWLADDWPTIDDIDRLVESANGVFIFAATLCRFIAENEEPAEDCLSRVLSSVRGGSSLSRAEGGDGDGDVFKIFDGMYDEILARSLRGREKMAEGLWKTLGAIAVHQRPLSATSLAKLMSYTGPEVVYYQLDRLHSVLQVSREPNSPIRVLHDSFRDFILVRSKTRTKFRNGSVPETHSDLIVSQSENGHENDKHGRSSQTAAPRALTVDSFHDSGIGSSLQQHSGLHPVEADTPDTASIDTNTAPVPLKEEQKVRLANKFVSRLVSYIRQDLKSDPAPSTIGSLLKDFAIIAKKAAGTNIDYRKAADFVRRRRNYIAASFDETAKAELQYEFSTHVSSEDRMRNLYLSKVNEDPVDAIFQSTVENFLPDHSDVICDDEIPYDDPERNISQPAEAALLDSKEFRWLAQRMRVLTSRSCPEGSYHTVRSIIANHLDRTSSTSELRLILPWDPLNFLKHQYEPTKRDISQTLVYCGSSTSSLVCTAQEYLDDVWPDVSRGMLACLQSACTATKRTNRRTDIAGATLFVELNDDVTTIHVSGSPQGKLEIAEAYIWLATSCRANGASDHPALCSPQLDEETLDLRFSYQPAIKAQPLDNGSCWFGMLRNPVVATGYPIPQRSNHVHKKGLEVSIDMLVALSGANWATVFRGKFLFMGLRSALVPVWESESYIVWHFLGTDSADCPMTYDRAHAFHANASVSSVTTEEIFGVQSRRHFVGIWTPSACVLAGSSSPALGIKCQNFYNLEQSDSKPIKHFTATPNAVSLAGGKYFNVGVTFTLGRKDMGTSISPAGNFESLLNMTENWKVLMYGSTDKRAWLVDGHTALLHVSIAYMFVRANEKLGKPFKFAILRSGDPFARSVLMENRYLSIYQVPEGRKVEKITSKPEGRSPSSGNPGSDSAYATGSNSTNETSRTDTKTTESDFTFEMLVSQFFEVMRLMQAALSGWEQKMPQVDIKKPTMSPLLVGWEIADIIREHTDRGESCVCCISRL